MLLGKLDHYPTIQPEFESEYETFSGEIAKLNNPEDEKNFALRILRESGKGGKPWHPSHKKLALVWLYRHDFGEINFYGDVEEFEVQN